MWLPSRYSAIRATLGLCVVPGQDGPQSWISWSEAMESAVMLVFIDESGCPGFKLSRGSAPFFGLGMIIIADVAAARVTEEALAAIRASTRHKPEFKFSKSSHHLRDAFFEGMAHCPFTVRALVVRKELLHSRLLRADSRSFYSYFVKLLLMHSGGSLDNARVRIDGSGSQEFQRSLGCYLHQQLGTRVSEVRMVDSAQSPLMQLADMCIGAIMRSERKGQEGERWRNMLKPRIADIWRFR
jgi:hypothetical protein